MKLTCAAALLLATGLVGCGWHPSRQELTDLAEGRCAASPLPLRLEARLDEGVFRIHNDGSKPLSLYYDDPRSFGPVLFFHRLRDADGKPIDFDPAPCGWWYTPADKSSELPHADEWRRRLKLVLPARGFVDLKGDVADMARHHSGTVGGPVYRAPCQIQVRFAPYSGRRTYKRVEAVTSWLPSPCPVPYRGPPQE